MARNSNELNIICFTLRQWALLLAILAFIITAVLTFGMMLGLRHTRDAWELVLTDLNDEEEEESENPNWVSCTFDDSEYFKQYKSNKRLLHKSQHVVQVLIFLLDIGTIFGCLNQIACGVMIYGICFRSANCVLPWLIISGITYTLVGATVLVSYFDFVPGVYVSLNSLIVAVSLSTLFLIIWYTILLYYYYLFHPNCAGKKVGTITPTIMQAYGGYIHKVDDTPIEKKIIV